MSSTPNSKTEYLFLRCNYSLSGFCSERLLSGMRELTVENMCQMKCPSNERIWFSTTFFFLERYT